jgi:hypothetical protein
MISTFPYQERHDSIEPARNLSLTLINPIRPVEYLNVASAGRTPFRQKLAAANCWKARCSRHPHAAIEAEMQKLMRYLG